MFQLWKCRRGRRAAVDAIAPLIERSRLRLNGIPEPAWLDPYMVGFLVMLITLVARHEVDGLDSQGLALVQSETWAEVTGLKADLIGEEVLHLSASGHKTFEFGCANAAAFARVLFECATDGRDLDPWGGGMEEPVRRSIGVHAADAVVDADIVDLWTDYFEGHVLPPHPARIAL
jgi:hypothetical protein